MLQRKCPQCKTGIMSDLYTFQGWGKEGMYACDSCGHSKSIYEGTTIGPYIFFVLFEVIIFFLEDRVSPFEYGVYGTIFVFLVYRIYKAQMRDNMIGVNYPVIGEFEDDFSPNKIQLDALAKFHHTAIKIGKRVKLAIALFITISYTIMFYFEESLDYVDYIGYLFIAIILPMWLVLTKFKGQDD